VNFRLWARGHRRRASGCRWARSTSPRTARRWSGWRCCRTWPSWRPVSRSRWPSAWRSQPLRRRAPGVAGLAGGSRNGPGSGLVRAALCAVGADAAYLPGCQTGAGPEGVRGSRRLLVWLVVAARSRGRCSHRPRPPGGRTDARLDAPQELHSSSSRQRPDLRRGSPDARPSAVSRGDEPHYLVITQSLLTTTTCGSRTIMRGRLRAYYDTELAPHAIAPGRDGGLTLSTPSACRSSPHRRSRWEAIRASSS